MEYQEKNPVTNTSNPPSDQEKETSNIPPSPKSPNFFSEIVKFSILAALIVIPIRLFIAQPFIVSGASMEPTFETGQYLIVDQLTYAFEAPVRGEVVIFHYPRDTSKFFIKRIIGLPGETVNIRGKEVIIKNVKHPDGIILSEPYLDSDNRQSTNLSVKLEDDEYFVLGDNRKASSDSRVWGPLKEEFLVGRAFLRLFPISKGDVFPGNFNDEE